MEGQARIKTPLVVRAIWLVIGASTLVFAFTEIGWFAFAMWLAPDLSMLAGIGGPWPKDGRMPPRAVPFYNFVHRIWPSLILVLIGVIGGVSLVLGVGLTWISHVAVDRAAGYGLRTAEGWQRGA